MIQISHAYMTSGNTIDVTIQTFFGKVMSLLFIMLSRLVIAFLPRSNHLLISWLQSLSAVIFGVQEEEICHYFYLFPFYLSCSNGAGCHNLSFFHLVLSWLFHSSPSPSSRGSSVPLHFLPLEWYHLHFWGCWCLYVHAKSLGSFLTLCDPMDCSLSGSSVHGIHQAIILEWVAWRIPWCRRCRRIYIFLTHRSNPCLLCLQTGRQILYH